MNYYKWQEIHKTNHAKKKSNNSETYNFAIDELSNGQKIVWQELQRSWRLGELAKLLTLAKTYDKASDTFRSPIG
ncbi:MAG: hypothetical protein BGO39_05470 [Chloroflexi bacterium 54-19]|nr:MAG: hypothetical protein BGO39_05470 [Chloroflexi bacterium 54-19]